LPVKPLIAGCPVSLRKPGDTSANNQVTMMMVECATDEADPVKRLLRINRSSGQGKGFVAAIAGSYDADIAIPGLPGLMRSVSQWLEAANLADRGLPGLPCNTVISNVPGPRQTMYSLGSRVLTHYPVSIPTHGQGVNITVQSYTDTLYFGITACAQALPEAGPCGTICWRRSPNSRPGCSRSRPRWPVASVRWGWLRRSWRPWRGSLQ
jgi:hypothetical protein